MSEISTARPGFPVGPSGHPGIPAPRPVAPSARARAVATFRAAHERPAGRRLLAVVGAAGLLGAGVLADQPPGLGVAVLGVLGWGLAAPGLVRHRAWSALVSAWLAAGLVAVAAVRAAPWVLATCLVAALAAGAVAATAARTGPGVALALPTAALGVPRAVRWAASGVSDLGRQWRPAAGPVLRVALVTLVLLVGFGALLAGADPVVAGLLPRPDLATLPARLAVGVLVALVALVLGSLLTAPPPWATLTVAVRRSQQRWAWAVPVLALAALLAAFGLVQVVTLTGGDAVVGRITGMTYAGYARQGFGQLLVVTAATLGVVAWWAPRAPWGTAADRLLARVALGALCLGALGVVAAALGRMALYVQAYGLTELRVLAGAAEIVLGVVLGLVLVAGVRWRGGWLPRAAVQVSAAAALVLALANPEALMVRVNAGDLAAPVDVHHLRSLSVDAVPAMDALPEPLRSCLLAWQEDPVPGTGWAGWNAARAQALAVDDVVTRPDCRSVVG